MIPQPFESSILMPTKTGKVRTLCKHKEKFQCVTFTGPFGYFGMKWNSITPVCFFLDKFTKKK